ncbi:PREDICTED: uncharacterized protein LOC105456148 isoform X2 [Wasmannia auropunctata]|nr:PREDICTED: uncharacterized protein LOC105456148 isoform X2 [Wasmannia auropunctata]
MLLSFLKDIVLEVIVIVITFLQWHKGSFSTRLLVEFILMKTVYLAIVTCKWYPTIKWYMKLRNVTKFRRFTIIARRSIASIANNIPGRVGRSLDDECLDIAIIRRDKYASLFNLDRHSEELSSRANAKSLTTLVTDDTSDTSDYNSDVNDLSVAEKSMRMLNVTAEDVMDARARIQERSYWEQEVIAKTPEMIEKLMMFSLEKNGKEMIDTIRNGQSAKDNLEKTVNRILKKEDIMEHLPMKKGGKKDNEEKMVLIDEKKQPRNQEDISLLKSEDVTSDKAVKKEGQKNNEKIVLVDEKKQILMENQEDVSLVKSEENVTLDKVGYAGSHNISVELKKKRKEKKEGVTKIVQCPSFENENARNVEAKPCASLVRKLKAKLCPVQVNVNVQLMSTNVNCLNVSKKEHYKISKMSCRCHRALHNSSKNGKHVQSIDIDGKNVEYDGKKFRSFTPIVNMQRSKIDKSAFRYSEAYRLKKQIQKWEESLGKQYWGSKSLAETARPSGYAKNIIDAPDKLSIVNCRKNIQTETCDGSTMLSDSLSERHRLKGDQNQTRSKRTADLRFVYNTASFREKNYAEAHEMKMKALETSNFMLENKRETRASKRHDLLPANRKLSIEQREAVELKALRSYNKLTLLEDKKELEVRKERDSTLNCERLAKKFEVSETKVSKTYDDPILPKDKKGIEKTRGHNLSPSFQRSIDERSISRVRDELTRSGSKREPQTGRKRDSSSDETPSECEEGVEAPASVSNRLSMGNCENVTIPARRNANSSSGVNDRCIARHAYMSLNLMEITRNIEWTVHPRGIILTNKNLHGRLLENERFRESRQRDIVDDNTVSTLHSAFFFKPEIITRVFRRARSQRIDEFFFSGLPLRREDFSTEFVCRVSNEMVVPHRDSSFDCNLERTMGNDRSYLGDSVLSNYADSHDTGGEHGYDLRIIFFDREEIPSESQTAMEHSTTFGSREDARSSIESTRMTNILVFDETHNRVGNASNDNSSARLITGVVRNLDVEMSEGSVREIALSGEEGVSNVNVYNNPQPRELNADDINSEEENNNECDGLSSHKNANIDDTIHEIEQTLNSRDDCLENVNVTSYASSLEKLNNSRDKKYLSTTDIHSESEVCEDNLSFKSTNNNTSQLSDDNNEQFDVLSNETEKSMFNRLFENSLKLSFPGTSSLIESDNCRALKSCDEELQRSIQLSDSATTLDDQRNESISNLEARNYDTIAQFRSVETLKSETTIQNDARSQRRVNRDEKVNEFLAEKIFKMHSDDNLQQDDSFSFMYERHDDPGTPVSLEDGSVMEEFLSDPVSPLNSSFC